MAWLGPSCKICARTRERRTGVQAVVPRRRRMRARAKAAWARGWPRTSTLVTPRSIDRARWTLPRQPLQIMSSTRTRTLRSSSSATFASAVVCVPPDWAANVDGGGGRFGSNLISSNTPACGGGSRRHSQCEHKAQGRMRKGGRGTQGGALKNRSRCSRVMERVREPHYSRSGWRQRVHRRWQCRRRAHGQR